MFWYILKNRYSFELSAVFHVLNIAPYKLVPKGKHSLLQPRCKPESKVTDITADFLP